MRHLYKILGSSAIAILILSFIVLDGGLRSGNLRFIILGGSVILVAMIIYFIVSIRDKRRARRNQEKFEAELAQFKQDADQIEVDLNKVKIKSNSWTEEVVIRESKYSGVDSFFGTNHHNIKTVKNEINLVELSIPIDGKTIRYKTRTDMNKESLLIHLAIKKNTILYVKDGDSYLDLEFLNR
jgi:hypothetical protein